jgi:peptide/nickel transport system substrate-binding protein
MIHDIERQGGKMKRKINLFLALVILVSMLLSACAPAAAPQAPAAPAAPAAPEQAPAAPEPTMAPVVEAPTQPPAAPAQPAAPAEPVNSTLEKPIVIAGPADVATVDPHKFNGMFTRSVGFWIFDVLVMNSTEGKPMPELAKEWKRVDDNTWEFKLVDNAKFHNGEPFNADAVVYSFQRASSENLKKYNAIFYETPYKEIKKVDDYTIQIITEKPFNDLLWYLGRTFIVAPKYYSEKSEEEVNAAPVGTGPFKFVEWVKDDHLTVVANEEYFQGAPAIKKAMVKVIPEASQRLNELTTGNVDLITNLPSDLAQQANSDYSRLVPYMSLRKMHLNLQLKNEYLANPKVREAMQYAIDRQTIIDTLMGGATKPLQSTVNPPNNDPSLQPYPYDLEKAKALLKEAGYENGFELLFQTTADGFGSDKEISQLIAQDLEKLGLKINLEVIEENKLWELLETHDHPGIMFLGLGTYNLPVKELNTFYSTDIDNAGNYNSKDYDTTVDALKVETNEAKRTELMYKAQQILWADMPWVYLWRLPAFQGQSSRFNLVPYPDGYIDIWQAVLQ